MKSPHLTIRLTPDQQRDLKAYAQYLGLPLSTWVRSRIMALVRNAEDYRAAVGEIKEKE